MEQLITPNPNIACTPGWCLMFVREAYGLPARYPTATAAWEGSESKHYGRDFPDADVPVWYGLDREPAGHVVIRMRDGSVYSTSDNTNTPHHHPSLDDLEAYYAGWGWPLTYRGWTEDVAGYPVIAPSTNGLASMGEVTNITASQEDEMISPEQMLDLKNFIQGDNEARAAATREDIKKDIAALSAKVDALSYGDRVFTQASVNQNADRVINDAHAARAGGK